MSDVQTADTTAGDGVVRCDACPVLCRIRPGKTGACDRYANVDGVLTRTDPLVLAQRAGGQFADQAFGIAAAENGDALVNDGSDLTRIAAGPARAPMTGCQTRPVPSIGGQLVCRLGLRNRRLWARQRLRYCLGACGG